MFRSFVRSGYVDIGDGKLWLSSVDGRSWSSWPNSDNTSAHNLGFNADRIGLSDYSDHWFGFPLRCLVR